MEIPHEAAQIKPNLKKLASKISCGCFHGQWSSEYCLTTEFPII